LFSLNLINILPTSILTEKFINSWTKIKELIFSGIAGVYFGHIKAYENSLILAKFEATVGYIPYSSGYSPKEW